MRKHTKFVAIAVTVVLVLAVALTTMAFASEPPADEGDTCKGPMQTFIGKVAVILGVEQEQLVDAFKQAHQEMRDEAMERSLQRAIENECITEQEANKIREWRQNRPEALKHLGDCVRLHLRDAWCHKQLPCLAPCP